MEITLEKIELVKDRTGVSYKEAKEALEQAGGSVVDAIIAIEDTINDKGGKAFTVLRIRNGSGKTDRKYRIFVRCSIILRIFANLADEQKDTDHTDRHGGDSNRRNHLRSHEVIFGFKERCRKCRGLTFS